MARIKNDRLKFRLSNVMIPEMILIGLLDSKP